MSDGGIKITERLIENGSTPFRVPQAPAEVHDFEIFASLGRVLRSGPGEGGSLKRATAFKDELVKLDRGNITGDGLAILETMEQVSPIPPSSGQSSKRLTFPVVPIVPAIGEISCFTRQKGEPWSPGAYVRSLIIRGSTDLDSAKDLWKSLYDSYYQPLLARGDADAWAVFAEESVSGLAGEMNLMGDGVRGFEMRELDERSLPGNLERGFDSYPARSYASDLKVILELNDSLTRRQWVSLMDCHLRLALASDILWICRMGHGLSSLIQKIWAGAEVPETGQIRGEIMPSNSFDPMRLDGEFFKLLKREVRQYGRALLLLQNVIRAVRKEDEQAFERVDSLGDIDSLERFLKLAAALPIEEISEIKQSTRDLIDSNPEFSNLNKSKFWTSQYYYALRHALGQRATKDKEKTHFDQGYWARRKGNPWKFSPGPAALFLMSHLTHKANNGIATAYALKNKLGEYGFHCTLADLGPGELGRNLRNLGLCADCSDAQGGLIIRSPFNMTG